MPTLDTFVELARPWAKFYSKSHVAQGVLMFAHIGGMLWGGGMAISADRNVWRLRKAAADERARLLAEIDRLHAPVIVGLSVSALSGVLLFVADLETYGTSWWFWGKMIAFALLLLNGRWLQVQEQRMQKAAATIPGKWSALTITSWFSMTLWFAVALGGVLLKNA